MKQTACKDYRGDDATPDIWWNLFCRVSPGKAYFDCLTGTDKTLQDLYCKDVNTGCCLKFEKS